MTACRFPAMLGLARRGCAPPASLNLVAGLHCAPPPPTETYSPLASDQGWQRSTSWLSGSGGLCPGGQPCGGAGPRFARHSRPPSRHLASCPPARQPASRCGAGCTGGGAAWLLQRCMQRRWGPPLAAVGGAAKRGAPSRMQTPATRTRTCSLLTLARPDATPTSCRRGTHHPVGAALTTRPSQPITLRRCQQQQVCACRFPPPALQTCTRPPTAPTCRSRPCRAEARSWQCELAWGMPRPSRHPPSLILCFCVGWWVMTPSSPPLPSCNMMSLVCIPNALLTRSLNKAPGDAWLEAARVMRGFCSASAAPHKAGGGKQRGRGMSGEEQEAANQTRQGLQSKRTMAACNGSPSPRCTCPVDCCITAAASLLFSSAAQAGTPRVDDDISAAAASAQQGALQPEETGRSSDVPRATGGLRWTTRQALV